MAAVNIPTWFLDIDGVINVPPPFSHDTGNNPKKRYATHPFWTKTKIAEYDIMYAKRVIDFINRVHHSGLIHIEWLTTWNQQAVTEFAPEVGLATFPVAGSKGSEFIYPVEKWWKYMAVEAVAEERNFIWTDDDLRKGFAAPLEKRNSEAGFESLVIAPHQSRGLENMHLKAIEEFATRVSSR
jgi:hypothetical protein